MKEPPIVTLVGLNWYQHRVCEVDLQGRSG